MMLTYICYSTTSTTKVLQNMLHICAVPYNVQQNTSFFAFFSAISARSSKFASVS